jgi:hypothetical protein
MEVYVLEAYNDSESSFILGIYETREKAEAAAKDYGSSSSIRYTDIIPYEVE